MAHAGGRPPLYTIELGQLICERIAAGEALIAICKEPDIPTMSTVFTWIEKFPEFAQSYARARDKRLQVMAEEIQAIADDSSGDLIEVVDKKGRTKTIVDQENIQRSKLRVDTRKWLLSKLAHKTYGDRTALEHSGPGQGPLEIRVVRVGREKP